MTTEQEQGQEQQTAALETEAAELKQDIKEAKNDAQQARKDGDDERATRLEASIAKTQTDLDEIKATLKEMAGRPYAPAPGDGETPPAPPAGEQKTETTEGQAPAEGENKPRRKHWMFGDRWNQD